MTSALLTLVLAAAGPMKVAVVPLTASGDTVKPGTAEAITEAVIAEIRRQPTVKVTTPAEVTALLGFERQKLLLGCSDDKGCMVEIGSALGVERLLMGSVALLGKSWLVHLKLLDSSSGAAMNQADRRLKDKDIDDVLDVIPAMVTELFGKAPPPSAAPEANPAPPAPVTRKPESGGVDEPFQVPAEVKAAWTLTTDGKGHYVVATGYDHSENGFFAGDGKSFWQQRIISGGADGKNFSLGFWDSRFPSGYQRQFGMKDGKYEVQCGEARFAYEAVPAAKAKELLAKASFFKPRWRRSVVALARDDNGAYFMVDGPREDGDEKRKLRMFHGGKGKMREVVVEDIVQDDKGIVMLSAAGRLKLPRQGDSEWMDAHGVMSKLSRFELSPNDAKLIYKDLGVYAGDPLRTPCDPHL